MIFNAKAITVFYVNVKTLYNVPRLQHTEGLSGMDLINAKLHNACAMAYNPFALAESVRQVP